MIWKPSQIFFLLLLIFCALCATTNISASKDATVIFFQLGTCQGAINCRETNFGSESSLYIGSVNIRLVSNVLIGFSLSSIPAGATVTNAKLIMPFATIAGNHFSPYTVYRATTSSWGENTVTWNNQPSTDPTAIGGLFAALKDPPDPLDVTAAVQSSLASGEVTFVIKSENGYSYFFPSREGGKPGILQVTYVFQCSPQDIQRCQNRGGRSCCYNTFTGSAECHRNEVCVSNANGETFLCPHFRSQLCATANRPTCYSSALRVCAGPNPSGNFVLCPRFRPSLCGIDQCYNPNIFNCVNGQLQRI